MRFLGEKAYLIWFLESLPETPWREAAPWGACVFANRPADRRCAPAPPRPRGRGQSGGNAAGGRGPTDARRDRQGEGAGGRGVHGAGRSRRPDRSRAEIEGARSRQARRGRESAAMRGAAGGGALFGGPRRGPRAVVMGCVRRG